MRARAAVLVAAAAVGSALLRAQAPVAQVAPQTFRTGTDVVLTDVSVREGGRSVTGLQAADFELTDNGVRQRIDSVEAASVPIDLTLVVDVSGSPLSPWSGRDFVAKSAAQIDREVKSVSGMLRPDDRLRLLAVDKRVQQIFTMRPVSAVPPVTRLEFGGAASLFDTLAAALMQPVEPARRHVVIARTKGTDAFSSIDAQALRAIAERSDALFHVVVMEAALDTDFALKAFQCELMGFCFPARRFWTPYNRRLVGGGLSHMLLPDGQAVAGAAESTGGALHQTEVFTEPTLVGTFRKAFDDFRSGYMLRYTPGGVPRSGWHAIDVKVGRSRGYAVRARKGYFVEEPSRPVRARPVPQNPRTLSELTAAYDLYAYREVAESVRQAKDQLALLRDFNERGNPWPANPHREAAFLLEVVEPAVFSDQPAFRDTIADVLARFSRLVRPPLEPDQFERYWYFAVLTLLEGTIRPVRLDPFVTRALARFPDEPRFLLSRAIAMDQRSIIGTDPAVVDANGAPTPSHADGLRNAYGAAMASPETAPEAHIRLAWFLHRAHHEEEALSHLTAAQRTGDPALEYLHQLFLGHVLWSLGRHDDAVRAYRAALAIVPTAQSAKVALMNAMLLSGDRAAAETLSEQVQTNTSNLDPWWMYWQGQYRLHGLAMTRLRELSK